MGLVSIVMCSRSVCRRASHFALWLCECADGGFRFDDLYLPALRAFIAGQFLRFARNSVWSLRVVAKPVL